MSIWQITTALNQEIHQAKLSREACFNALHHLTVITQYQFCMTVDRDMSPDEIERYVTNLFEEWSQQQLNHQLLDTIITAMTFSRDMKLKMRFLHIGESLLQKYQ